MTERHLLNLAVLPIFLIVFLIGCLRAYLARSKNDKRETDNQAETREGGSE